jgi:3-methylcrotonyl-CoA carboxylase alpha subunit
MFSKVLIANRGEIACRIAITCRRLGIATVAVYSDADSGAKHVRLCDRAVYIGPAVARESYLSKDKLIAAAVDTGAEAIHPGYGFLSEHESFAEACKNAGITFIGPPPSAIGAMGSKIAAKTLMDQAGIPTVPGYHGGRQDYEFLRDRARDIGFPVLLKASAGGGGRGMRIVTMEDDFNEAFESCRREALNSFGDDTLFIEKYLERPRHIEIQVFADGHGNCVHLFERDCSIQRRHQKVLEESPAPRLSEDLRSVLGRTAVAVAKAVKYVGAGTVEFILDQAGTFYFMEMNTRLQVEHPVTEMVTGQDLVEWQLRVAAGERLPLLQQDLSIRGHAIEARVYAENPQNDFLPSVGTLTYCRAPGGLEFKTNSHIPGEAQAVRVDSGVRQGDAISVYYDPMIAKIIAWGRNREEAIALARRALGEFRIVGVSTNIEFLTRLIDCEVFRSADIDTSLIANNYSTLLAPKSRPTLNVIALAVAALLLRENQLHHEGCRNDFHSPWLSKQGWRLNEVYSRTIEFRTNGESVRAHLSYCDGGMELVATGEKFVFRVDRVDSDRNMILIDLGNARSMGEVIVADDEFTVFADGQQYVLTWHNPLGHHRAPEDGSPTLSVPMPGRIIAVFVRDGQPVRKGDPLLTLEAMKIEYTIRAPADGTVERVLYDVGQQVHETAQLVVFQIFDAPN